MESDEIEFRSMFKGGSKIGDGHRVEARAKAERRSTMTAKERARGGKGRSRSLQMNFRCSPAFKALAAGLAKDMGVSVADVLEEAVHGLAKKKGYAGVADA